MRYRTRVIVGVILIVAVVGGLIVAARELGRPEQASEQKPDQQSGTQVPDRATAGTIAGQPFRDIAKAAMPMVVNIRTESRRQTRDLSEFFGGNDLFERFFGGPVPQVPREQILEGAGSGFVIEDDGLILTNNHVVGEASRISVGFYADEGEEYEAKVIGRDPLTDSALIQLTEMPDHALPVARLGSSGAMQPGDWVMAIGNPFNLSHTVTVGVVSAIDRPFPISEGRWQDVLQTDAAINPGNSGGPLINMRGEVVGINTAIFTGGAPGNVGVGFAVPIDPVRELLPELRRGTVTRGRLGVQITPVTDDLAKPLGLDEPHGALVRVVEQSGPAASAGIEPGDVIVTYNRTRVEDSEALVDMVSRTKPGTTVPVELVRDGRRQTVNVQVGELQIEDGAPVAGGGSDTGFGMDLRDLTPQQRSQLGVPQGRGGAVVTNVDSGSAAQRAGIRPGDVVLEVNRQPVAGAGATASALRSIREGDTAFVLVWRNGQEQFLTMTRK